MPLWLFVILIIAAYAFVGGVTYAVLSGYGLVHCEYGDSCDWSEPHKWGELAAAALWPFGIPVVLGIWLSRKLSPKREHISVLRRQLGEANSSLSEKDQELTEVNDELTAMRKKLEVANARLAMQRNFSTDNIGRNRKNLR